MPSDIFRMISNLIEKLGPLAVEVWHVRDEFEKVAESMTEIKAVIFDAEEQMKRNNHEVKVWLEKLKNALYEAEDLLDEFSTEDLVRKVVMKHKKFKKVRTFFSFSNPIVFKFKMTLKVRKLMEMFEDLNVGKRVFHFDTNISNKLAINQRDTYTFISEERVVGREDVKQALLRLVLDTGNEEIDIVNGEENISVISIVGIGGLGKTALAQLIFSDPSIKNHFQFTEWMCVADDISRFDDKVIAANIAGCHSDDTKKLVFQTLNEKIQGKRCLFVLDDVWNEQKEPWFQFKSFLVNVGKGSKIMITTRSALVAREAGTSPSSTYFLKGLDENPSWTLFCRHAFGGIGNVPENDNLVTIGKQIVNKCAGVPLAIRVIGALMRNMNSEEDWLNIKNKDLVNIDQQNQNVIFQLIKLSYDHLPFHLRKCFAFCSLFEKDSTIDKRVVTRLWIAQGFIVASLDESRSLEDIAEECFMTLLHRSFFQTVERSHQPFSRLARKSLLTFKMHGLMHDLASSVSNKEHVLINAKERQPKIDKQTRHISFPERICCTSPSLQNPSSLLVAKKLRTFLSQNVVSTMGLFCPLSYSDNYTIIPCGQFDEAAFKLIMLSFRKLRALTLKSLNIRKPPSCIGELKHLRYLDLSQSSIMFLPKSITQLYNLETLILDGCSILREWPKDMWKLTRLRRLEFTGCSNLDSMPLGIGQLTSLQTLSMFYIDKASELGELNNLTKDITVLGMSSLRRSPMEVESMNLMGKSRLEQVRLLWHKEYDELQWQDTAVYQTTDVGFEKDDLILQGIRLHPNTKNFVISGFGGVEISSSVNLFSNLSELSLCYCLRLQYLPLSILKVKSLHLDHLPSLEWIVNHNNSDSSSSAFSPSLEVVTLSYLSSLKGWCACSENAIARCCYHFKRLDRLDIVKCKRLISFPRDTKIRKLTLSRVGQKIIEEVLKHSSDVAILAITHTKHLKSLSGVLPNLKALSELYLSWCPNIDLSNDEHGCYSMQWIQLENLKVLEFEGITEMEYLPDGLEHVTTLQKLCIDSCTKFKYVAEWAKSLQELIITNCLSLPGYLGYIM